MKGVVIHYKEEKGFGFIKDENYEKRFFHISAIRERKKLLENLVDYFYSDYEERKCFILNFTPSQSKKGLEASHIDLTTEILNEKRPSLIIDAEITALERQDHTVSRIVQGFGKGDPIPAFAAAGGHGTYRMGYPETFKHVNLHFNRLDDIGWGIIDVRDLSLRMNNRSNITDAFVDRLRQKLLGMKTKIIVSNDDWILSDNSILKV